MGKAISIHSLRGGTGKSIIATNLAMVLLKKGFDVSLLDLDFRAPSLSSIFSEAIEKPVEYWLNDFFNNRCNIDKALIDISENCGTDGKILIGLANPSIYAILSMVGRSQSWEASALKKLCSLRSFLLNVMEIDYLIYDTTPGIQYSSINAVTSADLPIFVATSDPLDIEGVANVLSEFNDVFRNALILMNKVFPETESLLDEKNKALVSQLEETLGHPIIGTIPCYCDVLRAKRDYSLIIKDPAHPFISKLEEVAKKLVEH